MCIFAISNTITNNNKTNTTMKHIVTILVSAIIATSMLFCACEKTPDPEPTPTPNDSTPVNPQDTTASNSIEAFLGDWNLLATAYDAQIVMFGNTTDTTYYDQRMEITIARDGNSSTNVVISGTMYLTLLSSITLPVEFSTTGTVDATGLTVAPCNLNDNYTTEIMGQTASVDYNGVMTFNNPVTYPERGILTVTGAVDVQGNETSIGIGELSASCASIVAQGSRATK